MANPYQQDASDSLGHGLYCKTVIGKNAELRVNNALKYEEWKENPDVKLNMISYYGLPICNHPPGKGSSSTSKMFVFFCHGFDPYFSQSKQNSPSLNSARQASTASVS